jgi:hypothetical protein
MLYKGYISFSLISCFSVLTFSVIRDFEHVQWSIKPHCFGKHFVAMWKGSKQELKPDLSSGWYL